MKETPIASSNTDPALPESPASTDGSKLTKLWALARHRFRDNYRPSKSLFELIQHAGKQIPAKARIPALAAVVLLALASLYTSFSVGSARLRIFCQHTFHSAELSVSVDHRLAYSGSLNGAIKKRFGLFPAKREGALSQSIAVPAGKHLLEIRINAPLEGYDETRAAYAEFSGDQENTVVINAARRGTFLLAFQKVPVAPAESAYDHYRRYASSVLLTIVGSCISAAIGFIVQEFLKSQKQRLS